MLYVEQTYTNIIIWRESRFQLLFSTNSVKIDQSNMKYMIWTFGVHCEHTLAISVIKLEK
jgi:hypothetical protein